MEKVDLQAHPQTTLPETVAKIRALALEGIRVSSIIIQKTLNGRQRGASGSAPTTPAQRLRQLRKR